MLLFHGTSRRAWRKRYPKPGVLYMVRDPQEALSYAFQTAEYDETEGHAPEPIVLSVQLDDLKGLRRLPDDAAIRSGELPESATWKDTLRAVGSIAVFGPIDKYKRFFHVIAVEERRHADARPRKTDDPERFAARDRVFFEYHCLQSDESCDAELWHHTRQWATVLRRIEPPEIDDGLMYAIVFDDGFRYDVFDDELSRKPAPRPKARGVVVPRRR